MSSRNYVHLSHVEEWRNRCMFLQAVATTLNPFVTRDQLEALRQHARVEWVRRGNCLCVSAQQRASGVLRMWAS